MMNMASLRRCHVFSRSFSPRRHCADADTVSSLISHFSLRRLLFHYDAIAARPLSLFIISPR
jgi:hypothetical protein